MAAALDPLAGHKVALWPDNDEAGRGLVRRVRERLKAMAPGPATLRVLRVAGLPEKGDAADFVAAGRTAEELRALLDAPQPGAIQGAGALLAQNPNVENVGQNNGYLEVSLRPGVEDYSFVPQQLVHAGFKLLMLREEEVNLETAFMRLTKGMVQ